MNNEEMNGSLAVNEKVYRIVHLLGKGKAGILISRKEMGCR